MNRAKSESSTSSNNRYGWSQSYSTKDVKFQASVKEKASGIYMNAAESSKTLLTKDVDLSIESPEVFKPGFPLSVKVNICFYIKSNFYFTNHRQRLLALSGINCKIKVYVISFSVTQ